MQFILRVQFGGGSVRRFFLADYVACTNDTAVGRAVQRTKTIHDETHSCADEYSLLFVMSPSSPGGGAARVEFSGRRSRMAGLSSPHGGAVTGFSSSGEPSPGGVRRATEPLPAVSPGGGAAAAVRSRRTAEPSLCGVAGRRSRRRAESPGGGASPCGVKSGHFETRG